MPLVKEVINVSQVSAHIDALRVLSPEKLSHELICLDTNVVINHEPEIVDLIKKGVLVRISSVVIDELSVKPNPGILSFKAKQFRRCREFLRVIEPRLGKTVFVERPSKSKIMKELGQVSRLTLKRYVYELLIKKIDEIFRFMRSGASLSRAKEAAKTSYWKTIQQEYKSHLKAPARISDIWDSEADFKGDYMSIFEAIFDMIEGFFKHVRNVTPALIRDRLAEAYDNDISKDILIAEHFLEKVYPLKQSKRFLSKDKDLVQLIRLHAAYFPA